MFIALAMSAGAFLLASLSQCSRCQAPKPPGIVQLTHSIEDIVRILLAYLSLPATYNRCKTHRESVK